MASRDPLTYSFVPNLVRLPVQVSKLSDREGSFVQTSLQALSLWIYRDIELTQSLKGLLGEIWDKLPVRAKTLDVSLLPAEELNLFQVDSSWIGTRIKKLETVMVALEGGTQGNPLSKKVISGRYTDGLATTPSQAASGLAANLRRYLDNSPALHQPGRPGRTWYPPAP